MFQKLSYKFLTGSQLDDHFRKLEWTLIELRADLAQSLATEKQLEQQLEADTDEETKTKLRAELTKQQKRTGQLMNGVAATDMQLNAWLAKNDAMRKTIFDYIPNNGPNDIKPFLVVVGVLFAVWFALGVACHAFW